MLRLALRKYSPYLDLGLPKLWPEWRALFTRTYLKEDFQAGLSSAGVVVPLSLAIALASSVPPGVGLLTAILGGIVSSLFGGTPLAVSGPSAAMSILVGSVVQNHGFNYLLVVLFCCGILQLLGGIFGLGKLIQFIPIPVVSGFTAGIGAILAINQLPRAMGLPAPDQSQTIFVITHIKNYLYQTQPAALGLSLGTLGLTLLLRRGAPASTGCADCDGLDDAFGDALWRAGRHDRDPAARLPVAQSADVASECPSGSSAFDHLFCAPGLDGDALVGPITRWSRFGDEGRLQSGVDRTGAW